MKYRCCLVYDALAKLLAIYLASLRGMSRATLKGNHGITGVSIIVFKGFIWFLRISGHESHPLGINNQSCANL